MTKDAPQGIIRLYLFFGKKNERKIEGSYIDPHEIKIECTLMESEISQEFIEWAQFSV